MKLFEICPIIFSKEKWFLRKSLCYYIVVFLLCLLKIYSQLYIIFLNKIYLFNPLQQLHFILFFFFSLWVKVGLLRYSFPSFTFLFHVFQLLVIILFLFFSFFIESATCHCLLQWLWLRSWNESVPVWELRSHSLEYP